MVNISKCNAEWQVVCFMMKNVQSLWYSKLRSLTAATRSHGTNQVTRDKSGTKRDLQEPNGDPGYGVTVQILIIIRDLPGRLHVTSRDAHGKQFSGAKAPLWFSQEDHSDSWINLKKNGRIMLQLLGAFMRLQFRCSIGCRGILISYLIWMHDI